jgi:hypothetical protein
VTAEFTASFKEEFVYYQYSHQSGQTRCKIVPPSSQNEFFGPNFNIYRRDFVVH